MEESQLIEFFSKRRPERNLTSGVEGKEVNGKGRGRGESREEGDDGRGGYLSTVCRGRHGKRDSGRAMAWGCLDLFPKGR